MWSSDRSGLGKLNKTANPWLPAAAVRHVSWLGIGKRYRIPKANWTWLCRPYDVNARVIGIFYVHKTIATFTWVWKWLRNKDALRDKVSVLGNIWLTLSYLSVTFMIRNYIMVIDASELSSLDICVYVSLAWKDGDAIWSCGAEALPEDQWSG